MKNLPIDLYNKIQKLSEEVRFDLEKKGVVLPVKNSDGSISIGYFKIVKNKIGYTILNHVNETVVDGINLPQTAILVANGLALGRYRDNQLLESDKKYGYALFDEELHNRALHSKKKTVDHYDLMSTKAAVARSKKEHYKKALLNRYEKLIQLV